MVLPGWNDAESWMAELLVVWKDIGRCGREGCNEILKLIAG